MQTNNHGKHKESSGHQPVMPKQVIQFLNPASGQLMLDCTIGRGGHAEQLIPLLGPGGRYLGLDVDPENVDFARNRLTGLADRNEVELLIMQGNFRDAAERLQSGNRGKVDLLLADLGFASNQMNNPARGLAFSTDGPLDMRLDPNLSMTAGDLVKTLSEKELADLLYHFGEERLSKKIARKIVAQRRQNPIVKTRQLAELVRSCYGPRGHKMKIDPATRTFMALRIAVNGELDALDRLLADLPQLLAPGGRTVIISFHSLEDRQVKQVMLAMEKCGKAKRLTRKPAVATSSEIAGNPRSRSAKLRAMLLH